ncbi:hypothetical protein [Faecalibaculum rodentium]|uniref:hypothetical protein n=3 Tax=Faecalibaculum rodentium TaxID=1702221 RepID=UPI0026F3B852|nr:hypothetical protein [Faecalibaculum rodentium]
MTTDLILTLLLFAPCILVIVTELCFVEAYDPESPRSISEIMNKADMIEERIERRERKKTMTLNEYIAENGDKTIEIQDDGTIRVLEDKGPWKPEKGDYYYTVDLLATSWDADRTDYCRLELGNVFQTREEAERMVHRLKARKKFLDAGGHEGMDGLVFGDRYHVYPQRGDKILMSAKERNVTAFDIWFKTEADCNRAIDSLTKDEVAALCWTGDEE